MKKRFSLVIDQERCIGCEACTVACKIENHTKATWIRVMTENVRQQDTPEGDFPNLKMTFQPRLCNHCDHPPCATACPLDALVKREDGLVVLIKEKCDGCQVCVAHCPYDVLFYDPDNEKIEKCHFCFHRIDQGLEPFCVICCEGQALHFGDLNDHTSKVHQMVARKDTYRLNPEAKCGPSVYYCPPRRPRRL